MPITGLTDTSSQTTGTATGTASGDGSDASGTATTTPAAVAPTSAKFSYQVKDGQKAYIEVYLDGSSGADVAQNVDGPATKDYNCLLYTSRCV